MDKAQRSLGLGLALAVLVLVGVAPGAGAFYEHGAQIVSADFERLEQGDDTTVFAAISADGRYVAIQTRARNLFADDDSDPPGRYRAGGVFRFDLEARRLAKVADGDLFAEGDNSFVSRGASNPSISADGRFVAFSTTQQLDPADDNDNADVYVRDMSIPIGAPGAFEIVSARDGGSVPAGYGAPQFPFPGSNPGAEVSRGVAISADGRRVAFRTAVASDLPAEASADVPAGQVFVRDRVAETTTLVTRAMIGGAPAGGALGAALSADGTTVAWTGANAAAQTRFLGGESVNPDLPYFLWRRVADGAGAPTRRITGAADPDDPACPPQATTIFDQTSLGPCLGPLTDPEGLGASIATQLPALSADGETVAFLTGSGPRPNAATGFGLDLFVTSMGAGATRKSATVELTRETLGGQPDTGPPIETAAISPDGRFVAVTTARTRFAFPALRQLDAPRTVPGTRELQIVDLGGRTVERVVRSVSGGDANGPVQGEATVSAAGSRVAFVSFASNLLVGDANQRPDAFVASLQPAQGNEPPPAAGDEDGEPSFEFDRAPQIAARARSRPGGAVVVTVSVPAAGAVRAVGRARAGNPPKPRALAAASGRAHGAARSSVRLTLRPVRRYRGELRRRGRIRGRVTVTYVASQGGRRAVAAIPTSFLQAPAKPKGGG